MEENAKYVINAFLKANLSSNNLVLGFNTIAIQTLYYPFPATTISLKHLKKHQQITNALLPKIGPNRTFPWVSQILGQNSIKQYGGWATFSSRNKHHWSLASKNNFIRQLRSINRIIHDRMTGIRTSSLCKQSSHPICQCSMNRTRTRTFLRNNNAILIKPVIPTLPPLKHDVKNAFINFLVKPRNFGKISIGAEALASLVANLFCSKKL